MEIEVKKVKKKTKTTLERFTDLVSWFLGSWWAVMIHTAWFSVWLLLNFDVSLLTFSVSLEAIFIGIFLLMASNKAEVQRDSREARARKSDRKRLEKDIKLDEKADRQLLEIRNYQKELLGELRQVKRELKKLQK